MFDRLRYPDSRVVMTGHDRIGVDGAAPRAEVRATNVGLPTKRSAPRRPVASLPPTRGVHVGVGGAAAPGGLLVWQGGGVGKTMLAQNLAHRHPGRAHARFVSAATMLADLAAQDVPASLRRGLRMARRWPRTGSTRGKERQPGVADFPSYPPPGWRSAAFRGLRGCGGKTGWTSA